MRCDSWIRRIGIVAGVMVLAGCATLSPTDPPKVDVVGIEPLKGEGMEMRMQVKLRVLNPNDTPIEYNGVYMKLSLRGKSFADGVSDESGVVPRFSEKVVTVPVTIPVFAVVRQALDLTRGLDGPVPYELSGKLAGPGIGGLRFNSEGTLDLPDGVSKTK